MDRCNPAFGEWLAARKIIEDRLRNERARLVKQDRHPALREFAERSGLLAERWPEMNLDQRRAVIGTALDRVTVKSATVKGRTTLETSRLAPTWKL